MKKFLLIVTILLFIINPSFAKATRVEALSDYTSEYPPAMLYFKLFEYSESFEDIPEFSIGDIVEAIVIKTKDNKRLKQNATFALKINRLKKEDGRIIQVNNIYAKYTTKIDTAEVSKNIALGVGNYFVKGLSIGYKTVEGAFKNEEDDRLKSAGVALYKSTPLSYVEKGNEIDIKVGDIFLLNIAPVDVDNPSFVDGIKYGI